MQITKSVLKEKILNGGEKMENVREVKELAQGHTAKNWQSQSKL